MSISDFLIFSLFHFIVTPISFYLSFTHSAKAASHPNFSIDMNIKETKVIGICNFNILLLWYLTVEIQIVVSQGFCACESSEPDYMAGHWIQNTRRSWEKVYWSDAAHDGYASYQPFCSLHNSHSYRVSHNPCPFSCHGLVVPIGHGLWDTLYVTCSA